MGRHKNPSNAPAPTTARNEELRALERSIRKLVYVVKKIEVEHPKVADEARRTFPEGLDPREHSARATVSVGRIDNWIEHGESFWGRKRGSYQEETIYLAKFIKRHSHEDADGLWRLLRVVAQTPSNKNNPTPNECPFRVNDRAVPPTLLKRGKPYSRRTFDNMVSKLKMLIEEGNSPDQ